jgi:hypothetical protein
VKAQSGAEEMMSPMFMDKLLLECVEDTWENERLGRAGNEAGRNHVFAKALADLEIAGVAMRYVDAKGRVAWRATKFLRDHHRDLRLDAEADFENEDT